MYLTRACGVGRVDISRSAGKEGGGGGGGRGRGGESCSTATRGSQNSKSEKLLERLFGNLINWNHTDQRYSLF